MSNGGQRGAVTVREAEKADVALILKFIRDLAEYEREPEAAVATPEMLERHLFGENPVAHCLIAERDGAPAGFALYFFNFSTWLGCPGLYLEDLFVEPAFRRDGVGKALLQMLARRAVDNGCGRFEWAVLDWNEPAIRFYRSLGARPMDAWTIFRLEGDPIRALAEHGID